MGLLNFTSPSSRFALLGATALAAGCTTVGGPDPVDPKFQVLQQQLTEQTAARCDTRHDGSYWRGEFTNKDLANLAGSGNLEKHWPDISDDMVAHRLTVAVRTNTVFCIDTRLRGLTAEDGSPITAAVQMFARAGAHNQSTEYDIVIGINPVAPDAKNARPSQKLAMINAAGYLPELVLKYHILAGFELMGVLPPSLFYPGHTIYKPVGISLDPNNIEATKYYIEDKKVLAAMPSRPTRTQPNAAHR